MTVRNGERWRRGRKGGTNRGRRGNESNKSKERSRGEGWSVAATRKSKGERWKGVSRGREKDEQTKREEIEGKKEKNPRGRERSDARAPLPGLYGNVGQIYHSGLTVQFSYLPRAACRSTPNHPELQGRMEPLLVEAKPGYWEWGCWIGG